MRVVAVLPENDAEVLLGLVLHHALKLDALFGLRCLGEPIGKSLREVLLAEMRNDVAGDVERRTLLDLDSSHVLDCLLDLRRERNVKLLHGGANLVDSIGGNAVNTHEGLSVPVV